MTLKIENLTLSYGNKTLFSNLSFEVHGGESVLITGRNGAGKSTLLRRIAGIDEDCLTSGGNVFIDGMDSKEMAIAARCEAVGMIFQNPEIMGLCATVEDEIAFALENLLVEREEMIARIGGALSCLEIEHLKRKKTAKLSRGEKQLVSISAMLAQKPRIILADEPLSSLSAEKTALVTRAFENFILDGGTLVIVSHIETDMNFDRRIEL